MRAEGFQGEYVWEYHEWERRHNQAVYAPAGLEVGIVLLIHNWWVYSVSHRSVHASSIGDDGVLGPHWEAIGDGLRGLLNGDVGPRLDCGTLDTFIINTMKANGIDTKEK